MFRFFSISASVLFCMGSVLGADGEGKLKDPTIVGTYVGVVEGDQATVILKADGSVVIRPNDEDRRVELLGTWKRTGNYIHAKLKDLKDEKGTILLRVDNGDLVLVKIVRPDGEEKQFGPPIFKRKKRLADKAPVGVYIGKFDGELLQVEVRPGGEMVVQKFPE